MSKIPSLVETCPVCQVEFTAAAVQIGGQGSTSKTCPNGHVTPYHKLLATRKRKGIAENGGAVNRPSIFSQGRALGITGQIEMYQLALAAMLAGFQSAARAMPVGSQSRALLEGGFGKSPELTARLLDEDNCTQRQLDEWAVEYLARRKKSKEAA